VLSVLSLEAFLDDDRDAFIAGFLSRPQLELRPHSRDDEGVAIVIRNASRLSTLSHALDKAVSDSLSCSRLFSGVRSRNIAPCVHEQQDRGQRETSGSLRPRQNS